MYRQFGASFATVSTQQKEFLPKYVTMDETLIQHFTSESNWQSAEWTAADESCPKQPKMHTSAGKVLASIFWDAHSILFIDYLEKERTINSEYYITLLVHLKEEIAANEEEKYALSPSQCTMMAKLHELLPYPRYSPEKKIWLQ